MNPARLQVAHTQHGAHSILTVAGELDLSTSEPMRAAVDRALDTAGPVVIDLGGIEFMDSSGLVLLMRAHSAAASQGRRLAIIASSPVARVLDIAGVRPVLTVYSTLAEALSDGAGEPCAR